jgi:hypothetical protein
MLSMNSSTAGLFIFIGFSIPLYGCLPYSMKKGVYPIAVSFLSLYANSMIGTHSCQSSWCQLMYVQRFCLSSWLIHSICPSVCGWNAVERFCLIPRCQHNSFMNPDLNCDPWSLMMTSGIPWFRNILSWKILVTPSLVIVMFHSCTTALLPCLSEATKSACIPLILVMAQWDPMRLFAMVV